MEINLNTNVLLTPQVSGSKAPTSPTSATDSPRLDDSRRLDQSLQMTAEVRPEKVRAAQQLIGDVTYPPRETIRRIAALLAMHLDSTPPDDAQA